jgi:hypothetical protein
MKLHFYKLTLSVNYGNNQIKNLTVLLSEAKSLDNLMDVCLIYYGLPCHPVSNPSLYRLPY